MVADPLGALVHDDHLVQAGAHTLVPGDGGDVAHDVVGLVERRHAERDGAAARGQVGRRLPRGGADLHRLAGRLDVEPVPAAVTERGEREVDDDAGVARDVVPRDTLLDAARVRAVDDDVTRTARLDDQADLVDGRPLLPVAGRERVEVRPEADPAARGDARAGAGEHLAAGGPLVVAGDGRGTGHRGPARGRGGRLGGVGQPGAAGAELDVEAERVRLGLVREDEALQHAVAGKLRRGNGLGGEELLLDLGGVHRHDRPSFSP